MLATAIQQSSPNDLPEAALVYLALVHGVDMANSFLFARKFCTTITRRNELLDAEYTGTLYSPCCALERFFQ
jgi:hypothetical protein